MLRIRLQRVGRKHEPSFRLVLTESKNSTKSGRFKEILGSYDPRKSTDPAVNGGASSLNAERIKYWLSQGASPTDTVHNLLIKHKVINAKKIDVSAPSKSVAESVAPEVSKKIPMVKEDAIIKSVVEKETV